MKAIIPVAGLGTRFLPATKAQPKEMLAVVDKPIIQYIVEEVVASGITDIIFITSQGKRALEDHFDRSFELEYHLAKAGKKKELAEVRKISEMANFYYVRQREPGGTGDAILYAKNLIGNEPFAVLYGDDIIDSKVPCLKTMINIYDKYRDPVVAVKPVPMKDIHHYGVVGGKKIEKNIYQVNEIVEKPKREKAPSNLSIISRYVAGPEVMDILEKLKKQKRRGEFCLTDAFSYILNPPVGGQKHPLYAYEFPGDHFDCGSKLGFIQATVHFGKKHHQIGRDCSKWLKNI